MKYICKLTWRSICTFPGRYMALLLIVALSAGFFAGLKITKDVMWNTCDTFFAEQDFYDFRIFSTLGFTDEDVEEFQEAIGVQEAEGTYTADVMMEYQGSSRPYKLLAVPEKINLPALSAGRMPENDKECLADDEKFTEEDLGSVIRISGENEEDTLSQINGEEFTIVGLVDSPLYLGLERGTTGIGSGAIHSYLYLPEECFTGEAYTEINITLKETGSAFSDAYEEAVEAYEGTITDLAEELANERYENLLAENNLPAEMGAQFGITEPEVFVLTRAENAGYVSFESDTSIISGVANIFPVFFIMIAMLVCMTTMSRMVDEERTQIGVLKAMGFKNGAIMGKYLLYAGSATVIGWAIGFFVCTWGLPKIFWFAYNAIYHFAPLTFLFSGELAVITLAVSLLGILGSAYFSCRKELISVPAMLIRPRAAKNGKRILLERVTFLWKRLTFLQKITLRNMFRYKKRLIMMLVGISCCCGLVVTGFGVRDSMLGIGTRQYELIQTYDMEASFEEGAVEAVQEKLAGLEEVEKNLPAAVQRVDLVGDEVLSSVNLVSFTDLEKLPEFWTLQNGENAVVYPGDGEVMINNKIADKLKLNIGDFIEVRDADLKTWKLKISEIFDNHIDNFAFVSKETYAEIFEEWEANTVLLIVDGDTEEIAEELTGLDEITSVFRLSATKEAVDDALSCLDYIIWLIVLFSGALAFIVIFNLTNINLAERSREIATVEVLGFYPRETESYVLRENLVLSVIAGMIGLPLGALFHYVVMNMILIDRFSFHIYVEPSSYVLAFICTILFAVIVNLFMKRQIGKIKMAESLKAVE